MYSITSSPVSCSTMNAKCFLWTLIHLCWKRITTMRLKPAPDSFVDSPKVRQSEPEGGSASDSYLTYVWLWQIWQYLTVNELFETSNIQLHYTTLHYTTLQYTTLHYTTLPYTKTTTTQLHFTTLHPTTRSYTTLRYTTLHYTTLHSTTVHYATLHYFTLHYIPLR